MPSYSTEAGFWAITLPPPLMVALAPIVPSCRRAGAGGDHADWELALILVRGRKSLAGPWTQGCDGRLVRSRRPRRNVAPGQKPCRVPVQKSHVAIGWDDVAEMMPLTEVAAGGFVPRMRMRTSGKN